MASKGDDAFKSDIKDEGDESNNYAPHKFEANFSILEALGCEEYEDQEEFKTWCSKSSSWEILIKFEKEVPFANFSILVTLRRIDFNDYFVEGTLVISFLNIFGKKCPISYRLESALKGGEAKFDVFMVDQHFKCLLNEDDYVTFPDDVLVVKVQLFVKCCCDKRRFKDEKVNQQIRDELFRKMRMLCCARL